MVQNWKESVQNRYRETFGRIFEIISRKRDYLQSTAPARPLTGNMDIIRSPC